jgi:hypothetical protein
MPGVQYISESLRRQAWRLPTLPYHSSTHLFPSILLTEVCPGALFHFFLPYLPPAHSFSASPNQHVSSQLYNSFFYITAPRKPTNVSRVFPLFSSLFMRNLTPGPLLKHCTAHSPTPSSQTLQRWNSDEIHRPSCSG